jgi:hypothetical protein
MENTRLQMHGSFLQRVASALLNKRCAQTLHVPFPQVSSAARVYKATPTTAFPLLLYTFAVRKLQKPEMQIIGVETVTALKHL